VDVEMFAFRANIAVAVLGIFTFVVAFADGKSAARVALLMLSLSHVSIIMLIKNAKTFRIFKEFSRFYRLNALLWKNVLLRVHPLIQLAVNRVKKFEKTA
jgi:drug/metabolite transporter superfamily protein YnfA